MKKKPLKKAEQMKTPCETKNIWWSGYCLTDLYNFAEFGLKDIPQFGEEITIRKFAISKKDIMYTLGPKIIRFDKKGNNIIFDGKEKSANCIFFEYFKLKYKDCDFYWISSFNKKEKNYEMVGVVLNDELKGVLKLN